MIITSDAPAGAEPWALAGGQRERRQYSWPNGDRYDGEWLGDLMDGTGTWTGAGGDRYEGGWKAGERHGQGRFTGPGGECYDGEWKAGMENGRGRYSDPEDGWIDAMWHDGEALEILGTGAGDTEPAAAVSRAPQPAAAPAADRSKEVDEVMAMLRNQLKTRRSMGNARGFFSFFDADGDGAVDGEEFKDALSRLLPELQPDLLEAVYREVDADGDGYVDYGEFSSRMFRKEKQKSVAPKCARLYGAQTRRRRRGREHKQGVAEALVPISSQLGRVKEFTYVPKQKKATGRTDGKTIAEATRLKLSEEEIQSRQIDNIFRVIRQQMQGNRSLYGKKLKDARQAFRLMDKDGGGTLDEKEFEHAMRRLGIGLSEAQLSRAFKAIDTDGEGGVDYDEFVARVGLDDTDAGGAGGTKMPADAASLHAEQLSAEEKQLAATGAAVACAFEFPENGYTGVTFKNEGADIVVSAVVGGPAQTLGFGEFGLRPGARLTSINADDIEPSTKFVDALKMLQLAERPLMLGFEVPPVVVEVQIQAGSRWFPALVTQVQVQYDTDADGQLSGPIAVDTVQQLSVELLPAGSGLTLSSLPRESVRARVEQEPGDGPRATAAHLHDAAAQQQVRLELAAEWSRQADDLFEAAVDLGADAGDSHDQLLDGAYVHYHAALGHALAVVDTDKGRDVCVSIYSRRARLQMRRAKGDEATLELAREDADAALALDPEHQNASMHQHKILGMLWAGRDTDSEAVRQVQTSVRQWLVRKGRDEQNAAAATLAAHWRGKTARRALPARRRRKALADKARKTLRGAEKMLAATRPCGSLVRVEKALSEARSLAKRAHSAELVAKVDAVVAAVAARAKTEAKEIERRRIEKAMGAAQSDLVAEPFRALFTGGSTETVGGRPLF